MRCARILGDGSQIIRKDMLNKCETPRGSLRGVLYCVQGSCILCNKRCFVRRALQEAL